MKLSVYFDDLERIASKFSSSLRFELGGQEETPWEEIDIRLEQGLEVQLSELEIVDGLLSYQGRHVILYIRDHGRNVAEALEDPSKGRKFHVADCETLEMMRSRNRFDRYVVTRKASGQFEISGIDQISRQVLSGEAKLQVCLNCLKLLNYQSILLQNSTGRRGVRDRFALVEFFETYSTRFRELPSGFAASSASSSYSADWAEVSRALRESVGYKCQECTVCLDGHVSLLHVHHVNGVKNDNRTENLRVLCKDCHRKQPLHGHIFLTAAEMSILYSLRRAQGIRTRDWDSALKHVDLAFRPILELAKHNGWEHPEVGLPSGDNRGVLDAAWARRRVAISGSVPPGRQGEWEVRQPGAVLVELAGEI